MVWPPTSRNSACFSLASCITDDTTDSASLATPLDASPAAPPSAAFSLITVITNESYPARPHIPTVAATAPAQHRRYLHDHTALSLGTMETARLASFTPPSSSRNTTAERQEFRTPSYSVSGLPLDRQPKPLWPRIKRMLSNPAMQRRPTKYHSRQSNTNETMHTMPNDQSHLAMDHLPVLLRSSARISLSEQSRVKDSMKRKNYVKWLFDGSKTKVRPRDK
ncbi:uncharacterized protein BYT42DRAFT_613350 [Radiomyces spectabilis]|uniref:uncharacterized protein n=1 Tax=Radiomyces spectabilis TaxID=64574 RepID=UPI00222056A5|nr:uncharacterized protein BYT42DRAFT_613350 [Radiomyces spectabilis]KAI8381577.1 hypothetical protein BYT42DRAFT_613350 [Radiomyces spectabilis]